MLSLYRSRTCFKASSVVYFGLSLGAPLHFDTGLHVTTTTVSVYGIYRYLTCLFVESNFLNSQKQKQKQKSGKLPLL